MKSCKFCYAEIHARARVCPLCSSNQTLFGAAKGVVVTTVSIITALASIGMAAFEKIEKLGINTQLAGVMDNLKVEEAKSEAATQAIEQLAGDLSDDDIEEKYVRQFGKLPSAEKLDEIEAKLSDDNVKHTLSKDEMIRLQNEKIWLWRMHGKGRGHGPQRPIQQSSFFSHQRPTQTAERPDPLPPNASNPEEKTELTDESGSESESSRGRSPRSGFPRRSSTPRPPTEQNVTPK